MLRGSFWSGTISSCRRLYVPSFLIESSEFDHDGRDIGPKPGGEESGAGRVVVPAVVGGAPACGGGAVVAV